MYENLTNLGINLTQEQKEIFNKYISLFLKYNENINLISNNDTKVLYEKHIYDSLALNLFLRTINKKIKLLDIGTGGGFPALPLAIAFNEINITCIDSINKKINFIKSAVEELNIKNLKPVCSRIEDLKAKNEFDIVTSRAMADLREILEYAIPFLKTNGYFIAYKSLKADIELQNAKNALKVLNTELINKIEYSLPLETNNTRVLLIFKKIKDTPEIYPRKNGLIKKKPL